MYFRHVLCTYHYVIKLELSISKDRLVNGVISQIANIYLMSLYLSKTKPSEKLQEKTRKLKRLKRKVCNNISTRLFLTFQEMYTFFNPMKIQQSWEKQSYRTIIQ